jgi:lipoate-protein ligase A
MLCRILPHEVLDGAANMALDEALLDAMDADPAAAVLRTYGWSEPTLSLGYFQPIARAEAEARWRGVPTVRRPTGGGALWHDRELTYALVVPRSHPLARRPADLYRAVHEAIAGALVGRGVAAARRGESPPGEHPFLCFADRDPEDVLCGGSKVVGSAQRRRPAAVLQHGALLLARSARAPELPGLAELAGVAPEAADWAGPLRARIVARLGLEGRPGQVTADERRRADALARDVYRNPAWTRRR